MVSSSPPSVPPASTSIRTHLLRDHEELEALFDTLLAALRADDRDEIAAQWTLFDARVVDHMELEENGLVPALMRRDNRPARVILEEHRHFRTRLIELGQAVDLHTLRLETALAFIEELRAHQRHEDKLLYRWSDENLSPIERDTFFERVRAAMQRFAERASANFVEPVR